MPDDGSIQSAGLWPLAKFSFKITWDGTEFMFQEISGLSSETQTIEYRAGNSPAFSTLKMPGLKKFGNVTMKKGIFKGDKDIWNKFFLLKTNTIKRSTIIIELLDENGARAMAWTLLNAFPAKISGTDLKSDGNEVAIETMEFAHEGLSIVDN